ncbi:MAG: FMN-binding protein [Actinobacteria bacterium]|nr:FMN-binding protein [Actinomycetota bacterium]
MALLAILSLLLVSMASCGVYSWRFTSAVRELVPGEITVGDLADGEYEGEYRVFHVYARVRVWVAEGKIVEIELVNAEKMQRADAARVQETMARVVEEQSLQVDLVSGASASQKAALKAVEKALSSTP